MLPFKKSFTTLQRFPTSTVPSTSTVTLPPKAPSSTSSPHAVLPDNCSSTTATPPPETIRQMIQDQVTASIAPLMERIHFLETTLQNHTSTMNDNLYTLTYNQQGIYDKIFYIGEHIEKQRHKLTSPSSPDPTSISQSPRRDWAADIPTPGTDSSLTTSTTPQQFKYLFLESSQRLSPADMRTSLYRIGIKPSDILDVYYPASRTVALLIDLRTLSYILSILTSHPETKDRLLDTFDPTDPKHLANRRFSNCSRETRTHEMKRICSAHKLNVITSFTDPLTQQQLTNYFVLQGWILPSDSDTLRHQNQPDRLDPAHVFGRR